MTDRAQRIQEATQWFKMGLMAHGRTVRGSFRVPEGVAIVFMTHPGDFCADPYVQHMVMSEEMTNDLLFQRAQVLGSPVFSVVYLPGDRCPQTEFFFDFDGLPEGIWHLPLPWSFPRSGDLAKKPWVLKTAMWTIDDARQTFQVDEGRGVLLSDVATQVVPALSKGRNAVVYVMTCRETDSDNVYRAARKMNAAVSAIPINSIHYKGNLEKTRLQLKSKTKNNPFVYGSSVKDYGNKSKVFARQAATMGYLFELDPQERARIVKAYR
jgi:hypothetical protein